MLVPGSANPLLASATTAVAGYQISRSLRFNSSDSAYLSRTPASAGNRKTWTWSGWVKRSGLSVRQNIFGNTDSTFYNGFWFEFFSGDQLRIGDIGAVSLDYELITSQVFRDCSSWGHLVVAVDTTQTTASNRVRVYWNGTQITAFSASTYPTLNFDTRLNTATAHSLGRAGAYNAQYLSGYLADIHFVDGQALTPSSFGQTDATTGQWVPIAYTGTYPGNSFKLNFADNSAATAAALGKDTSGNGNNWTPNNLSVTNGFTATPSVVPTDQQAAFDGNQSTYAYGPSATTWTFNPPLSAPAARLDLHARSGWTWTANTNLGVVTVSDTGSAWPTGGAYPGWYAYANAGLTTIYSISVSAGANWTLQGVQTAGNPVVVGTILLVAGLTQNDSLVDTPTSYGTDTGAGGEVRGNYATWNPNNYSSSFFSDGNLKFAPTSGYNETAKATMAIGGKCYFEVTILSPNTAQNYLAIGLMRQETQVLSGPTAGYNISVGASGNYTGSVAYFPYGGTVNYNGSSVVTGLSTCTVGDVVGISYDPSNGQVKVYKNGVALNSGNAVYTLSTAYNYAPAMTEAASNAYYANFGQRPFAYTAPSGFKALCDTNLPAPTIVKPSTVMDVKLYTGNGGTQTISGLGFRPDLIWSKLRNTSQSHRLFDSVRDADKVLFSNDTVSESTDATQLTSFNNDGFTLGSGGSNSNGFTYVAWCWDAGSSNVVNTQGTITSTLRANPSAGFSVVTYTGTGANATVGHGLGVAPQMIIVKSRNDTYGWKVYHSSIGNGNSLVLNSTAASTSDSAAWNSTSPTSSVFSIGNGTTNASSITNYVAYCFAPVAGYSAFGSYTGNGTQVFVYTGFKPRWILLKTSGPVGGDWFIYDTARDTYNVATKTLSPNLSGAEVASASSKEIDILSNGFLLRADTAGYSNYSNWNYIYAAFAEFPFQYARAR